MDKPAFQRSSGGVEQTRVTPAATNNNSNINSMSQNTPSSSTNTAKWTRNIVLAIVGILLAAAVFAHFMWTYNAGINHAFVQDPTADGLKLFFAAIMGVSLVTLLLFTPTQHMQSPIFYIAESIGEAHENYKNAKDWDAEKKKNLLIEIVILVLIQFGLVAAYYLLIKSVVRYDESYMIDESVGLITVLSVGVVILVFIAFTSYIVGKLKAIDSDNSSDHATRQAEKNKFTIIMVIGIILCIAVGNSLSAWAVDKAQANDGIISNVLQLLGGERESVGWGGAELDIFN